MGIRENAMDPKTVDSNGFAIVLRDAWVFQHDEVEHEVFKKHGTTSSNTATHECTLRVTPLKEHESNSCEIIVRLSLSCSQKSNGHHRCIELPLGRHAAESLSVRIEFHLTRGDGP